MLEYISPITLESSVSLGIILNLFCLVKKDYDNFIKYFDDINKDPQYVDYKKYINFNKDTFNILFNSFETAQITRNGINYYTTLSKGEVLDEDLILIDPGFHYKGKI